MDQNRNDQLRMRFKPTWLAIAHSAIEDVVKTTLQSLEDYLLEAPKQRLLAGQVSDVKSVPIFMQAQ